MLNKRDAFPNKRDAFPCAHDYDCEHNVIPCNGYDQVKYDDWVEALYEGAGEMERTIATLTEKVRVLEAECALWRSGMASPAYLRMAAVVEAAREHACAVSTDELRTALAALDRDTALTEAAQIAQDAGGYGKKPMTREQYMEQDEGGEG